MHAAQKLVVNSSHLASDGQPWNRPAADHYWSSGTL